MLADFCVFVKRKVKKHNKNDSRPGAARTGGQFMPQLRGSLSNAAAGRKKEEKIKKMLDKRGVHRYNN